jgi:hypothetical protein
MSKVREFFITISRRTKISTSVCKAGAAIAAFTLLGHGIAVADTIIYISNTVSENIQAWDVTTNSLNTVLTSVGGTGASGQIDGLMFVNPTTMVYSVIGGGGIGVFTCAAFATNGTCSGAQTDNFLNVSPNNLNNPASLAADPGGATFLVSSSSNNGVYRINLSTGAKTQLFDAGMRADSLAYDSAGDLFAIFNENEIAQIDPTTGAIVKTLAIPVPPGAQGPQAGGLTFDAATGFLYVATNNGGVYQIDTGLTTLTYQQILTSGNTQFGGIASTGNTLYIVNRNQGAIQYLLGAGGSVTGGTLTETSPFDSAADDIALATFGSVTTSSPEPGSFLLIGAGLLLIGIGGRRMSQFTGPRA